MRRCRVGQRRRPVDRRTHQRMPEPDPAPRLEPGLLPPRGARRLSQACPAAWPRATQRPDHRTARPPPPAVSRRVCVGQGVAAAGEAVLDPARPAARRPAGRTRPPVPPGSARAAAPAAPAGCPASRRRSGPGPAHPVARPSADASSARASLSPQSVQRPAPAARPAPGPARGPRTPARPDSAARRRATNASVCADARSSHCSSSIRQISGRSSATSDSRLSTRQPDQEPVHRWPGGDTERGPQRIALRHRNPLEMIQHRRAQLMQPGERQLHLRLHAHGARHPAPGADARPAR